MSNNNVESFATGLAQSLNMYMGNSLKLNQELAVDKQKIDYSEAAKERSQNNMQNAELKRQKELEAYKQQIMPEVDAATADSVVPGLGKMVQSYKEINGRNPDPETFKKIASLHPKAQGLQMVKPQTLADLAYTLGADEATVAGFRGLKSEVPTGVATEALKNVFDKGLKESQVFAMYKEIMPYAKKKKDPSALGEDWLKFKMGIMEPGKTAITSDEEFTKIGSAVDQVVQRAIQDGKTPGQAVAIGAQVISKYDRRSKARLLFRLTSRMKEAQQNPTQQDQQGQ